MSPINLVFLAILFRKTAGRVAYLLGAKPTLGSDTSSFSESDCSGWVRWALDRCGFRLPDGSQGQLQWFADHAVPAGAPAGTLKRLAHYSDVTFAAKDPERLFIAFLKPKPGQEWPRHVWLLRSDGEKMVTMECHGHGGVDSRAWDDHNLVSCVDCFEIPATM